MKPMRAWPAKRRKSQATASSAPPPRASPLSAASTGTGKQRMASNAARDSTVMTRVSASLRTASSSRKSPPAAKLLSPAPLSTAAFRVSSAAASPNTVRKRSSTARLNALCFSGRATVTCNTPSRTSLSTTSLMAATVPGGSDLVNRDNGLVSLA